MDREILFRGKSISTGEWIQGDGIHYPKSINYLGTCWIDGMENRANDWIQVDPATVGQFTGLCDKDRKKIFEGDEVIDIACPEEKYVVEYFQLGFDLNAYPEYRSFYELLERNRIKVIGNIHDTVDLAKEESE